MHGQPAGRHVMTPELVSDKHLIEEHRSGRDIVQDAEHAAPPQRLFPIFRPKSQWKVRLAMCQEWSFLSCLHDLPHRKGASS